MNYKYLIFILIIVIVGLAYYLYTTVTPDKENKPWYEKIFN